ncbi:MAG: Lrp/AsnC family transcriptional regulator [Candidatus Hodarchaeota archaeon]
MKLKEIDYKILKILRMDSRTPFTEIGQKLGISDATVHVRVKRMMKENIIKNYTIEVINEVLGRNICGFVLLNVIPGFLEEVAKRLVENKTTSAVYEIHGPYDLIIKVWTNNLDELRDQLLKIREIPNVTTTELITVYKVWKETSV